MPGPTDRNDPAYANNPHYVWSGGRWQYVENPATANDAPPGSKNTWTQATVVGTPNPFSDSSEPAIGWKDPAYYAHSQLKQYGINSKLGKDADYWEQLARDRATTGERANPFDRQLANQSRQAQNELLGQLYARTQGQGGSISELMGAGALGSNAMSALAAAGGSPLSARGAINSQAAIGADLANRAALSRMAENQGHMRAGFQGATAMRGGDLSVSEAEARAGHTMRELDDKSKLFYASKGQDIEQARRQRALETYKLYKQLLNQQQGDNNNFTKELANRSAQVIGTGMGM